MRGDIGEDECLLQDGTLEAVLNTVETAERLGYQEIFFEGLFFLTILATTVTTP